MSLSQALSTSTAGLRTAQAALSLIASNVANAETPGFVRKTLVQTTISAGGSGVSVRVAAIQRELDQYLQRQLRVETSGGAYADLRAQFYSRMQRIYGAPGSASTIETSFNNLVSSLQSLSTSLEAQSARSAVLSSAQVLAQTLNGMTADIQGLRSDAELGLADAVQRANYAMEQIANINNQLGNATADDAAAAALRDQRDAYVDELAHLMDIKVVNTDHNQITVFTNSGIQLVGTKASRLEFEAQGTMTPAARWSADPAERTVGTLLLVSPTGGSMDLIANKAIRSGEFAALVEMRDQILVEAQAQLDEIAAAMASALSDFTVNGVGATSGAQVGFDIDTNGLLNGNRINLTYTDTLTNEVHRVTIIRVDDPAALPLTGDDSVEAGDEVIGVNFSGGLAAVAAALNSRFNGKITFSDNGGGMLRILDDGALNNSTIDAVTAVKTRTTLNGGTAELPFFTDASTPFTGAISSLNHQRVGFAGRILVNASLLADPSKLVAYAANTPSGDPTRPTFILDRLTSATLTFSPETGVGAVNEPFAASLPSFLRQVIGLQGEAAENAQNLAAGQEVVVNALQQRLTEESAVNIDVEMAHLLAVQNAYGANARVMSVVKEMIDTLMSIL